jgi:DNA helicase-2/ATP-dependent DNA helicase PcrA
MDAEYLSNLNEQQRAAVLHGDGPLLIIAGAGTGKTNTLAHRVAHLISGGIEPGRVLLLTFTRRAAAEMLRRVEGILGPRGNARRVWGGTFHAMAHRLLRLHGRGIGLGDDFTVVDRADAEDLLNDCRSDLKLDASDVRFPRKGTCLSIYSRCVNARETVDAAIAAHFPWCAGHADALKGMYRAYTLRKQADNVLDYDDLLLFWHHLMHEPAAAAIAADVRGRFDAVLVDEYQDTNALQAGILHAICPSGRGLTVVGDDAQSIYSFRAATVSNILDFPAQYPGTAVRKLEQNYRSTQPILEAANAVIGLSARRHEKELFSERGGRQKPRLVTLMDEPQQSDYLIGRVLAHHEAGIALRRQAVLFRAAHHSDALEVELSRRNIPFVKYGGLKFLEAAHVKDLLSILRLAENPRDTTSAARVLQLLDGVGPATTRRAITHLAQRRFDFRQWLAFEPPAAAAEQWPQLVELLAALAPNTIDLAGQIERVRNFYSPILARRYDQAAVRVRDIEQLEQMAGQFGTRQTLLADLTLDPPSATQDLAGPPSRDEDYLILSTIHSAKGCEWDAVFVIHAADGNIPSDMATGSAEEIEEERRLLYVALTRARDFLEVCFPLKYYAKKWATGDRHTMAQLSRFLPADILRHFELVHPVEDRPGDAPAAIGPALVEIRQRIADLWA